jgi:hypothetical protein
MKGHWLREPSPGFTAGEHFDRFLPKVSANSAFLVSALLNRLQEDDRDLTVGA